MVELYFLPLESTPSAIRLNGRLAFLLPCVADMDESPASIASLLKRLRNALRGLGLDVGGRSLAHWQCLEVTQQESDQLDGWLTRAGIVDSGWLLDTYPDESASELSSPVTLSLNVTEQCNIACTYCYFSGGYGGNRQHNNSYLPPRATELAIQRFFNNEERANPSCLYLFGGEPLLALPQVRHALELVDGLGLHALKAMASNGMLLDDEAVELLDKYNVYIAISLDGPDHDRARVHRNGAGSRRVVEERLEWLLDGHTEFLRTQVSTSCVVDAGTDLEELYRYFRNNASLRAVLHWDFDIILSGLTTDELFGFADRSLELLIDYYMDFVTRPEADGSEEACWRYFFASGFNIIHRTFWSVAARDGRRPRPRLVRGPLGTGTAPGSSMVTVRPNGELLVGNERQKASYVVGSVETGVDQSRVRRLADRFEEAIARIGCRLCWAAPMCTLTLSDFDVDDFGHPTPSENLSGYHQRCVLERRLLGAFSDRLSRLSRADKQRCNAFIEAELAAMP